MRSPARTKLRPADARRSNLALVLQGIHDGPASSRADLARATGLTKVTVSDLVAELIETGLVSEVGASEASRPGKPATMLRFNTSAQDVLAIDLSARDRFRGAVLDLAGTPTHIIERELDGAVGEDALAAAGELAADLIRHAHRPILGLGVGTPGTVSPDGVVLAAPNLRWQDLPLQDRLADNLGIPVRVANDANAAVLAERRFAGGPDDLVRIQLSRGVGAGLLVGGSLVLGSASDAGEIGHVVIDEQGGPCSCGNTGCLETWISVPALTARIAADPDRTDAILAQAGRRLGRALAPVVGMLGQRLVVVGGPDSVVTDALITAARDEVALRTRSPFRPDLELLPSSLGTDAVLLGAAALIMLSQLGVA